MNTQWLYSFLADSTLALHVMYVLFVVLGLLLVFAGGICDWRWVRNRWFRLAHLLAIAVVVVQTWFGLACPLTTLEMALRERAGGIAYSGSFVGHWLQTLLYYDAPGWVFGLLYTAFGLLVAASWLRVPPRPFKKTAV